MLAFLLIPHKIHFLTKPITHEKFLHLFIVAGT